MMKTVESPEAPAVLWKECGLWNWPDQDMSDPLVLSSVSGLGQVPEASEGTFVERVCSAGHR